MKIDGGRTPAQLLTLAALLSIASLLACAAPSACAEGLPPELAAQLMQRWERHLVPVSLWVRRDEGDDPHGELESPWTEERPHRLVGLAVDAQTVWLPYQEFELRFVARFTVGDESIPARCTAWMLTAPGLVLALDRPLAGLEPIRFVEPGDVGPVEELVGLDKSYEQTGWCMSAARINRHYHGRGADQLWVEYTPGNLMVRPDGEAVGFTLGDFIALRGGEHGAWLGAELRRDPLLEVDAFLARRAALTALAAQLLPTVEIQLRAEEQGDQDRFTYYWRQSSRELERDGFDNNQARAGAFAIGPRRLLVDFSLTPDTVARLERLRVNIAGEVRPARFIGALRDYACFLIEVEGDAPLPATIDLAQAGGFALHAPLIQVEANHEHGHRSTRVQFARVVGRVTAYRGVEEARIEPFQSRCSLFFSATDGAPLGAVLEVRRRRLERPGFMQRGDGGADLRAVTLAELREVVARAEQSFDPRLRPRPKGQERDFVWLGVEYQSLTLELAVAQKLEEQTRGGRIGYLVTNVHADSPAALAGVQPGDVWISVREVGRPEPIELEPSDDDLEGFNMWEQISTENIPEEMLAEYMAELPPPWRSARNHLNQLLTEMGAGAEAEVVSYRAGERLTTKFRLEAGPIEYESAPKQEIAGLGLTVRDATFEVRAFYRLDEKPPSGDRAGAPPAVVVSKVESGEKAAVAKILPYELILEVNGAPVASAREFAERIEEARTRAAAGAGPAALELRMQRLGTSRLVRIPWGET